MQVARALQLSHTELIVTVDEALATLPRVARCLESYSPALIFDGILHLLYEEARTFLLALLPLLLVLLQRLL